MSETDIKLKKVNKVLICWNTIERGHIIPRLKKSLEDIGYEAERAYGGYDLKVFDYQGGKEITISSICTSQWSFWNHLRGKHFDEMIVTRLGLKAINDKHTLEGIIKNNVKKEGKDSFLIRIALNSSKFGRGLLEDIEEGVSSKYKDHTGHSLFENINFPVSLYRKGMDQYFEDPEAPTHGEFLMALALEGVNASTQIEEEAVQEAIVRSKG